MASKRNTAITSFYSDVDLFLYHKEANDAHTDLNEKNRNQKVFYNRGDNGVDPIQVPRTDWLCQEKKELRKPVTYWVLMLCY